jgi:HSP20 family protein
VHVGLVGRDLTISGERRRESAETAGSGRYQQMEIDYGPFRRAVTLAEDVDSERAEARYERGLLVVTLPLAERPRAQERVPIAVRTRP